jgi:hypothetical protein
MPARRTGRPSPLHVTALRSHRASPAGVDSGIRFTYLMFGSEPDSVRSVTSNVPPRAGGGDMSFQLYLILRLEVNPAPLQLIIGRNGTVGVRRWVEVGQAI